MDAMALRRMARSQAPLLDVGAGLPAEEGAGVARKEPVVLAGLLRWPTRRGAPVTRQWTGGSGEHTCAPVSAAHGRAWRSRWRREDSGRSCGAAWSGEHERGKREHERFPCGGARRKEARSEGIRRDGIDQEAGLTIG